MNSECNIWSTMSMHYQEFHCIIPFTRSSAIWPSNSGLSWNSMFNISSSLSFGCSSQFIEFATTLCCQEHIDTACCGLARHDLQGLLLLWELIQAACLGFRWLRTVLLPCAYYLCDHSNWIKSRTCRRLIILDVNCYGYVIHQESNLSGENAIMQKGESANIQTKQQYHHAFYLHHPRPWERVCNHLQKKRERICLLAVSSCCWLWSLCC